MIEAGLPLVGVSVRTEIFFDTGNDIASPYPAFTRVKQINFERPVLVAGLLLDFYISNQQSGKLEGFLVGKNHGASVSMANGARDIFIAACGPYNNNGYSEFSPKQGTIPAYFGDGTEIKLSAGEGIALYAAAEDQAVDVLYGAMTVFYRELQK